MKILRSSLLISDRGYGALNYYVTLNDIEPISVNIDSNYLEHLIKVILNRGVIGTIDVAVSSDSLLLDIIEVNPQDIIGGVNLLQGLALINKTFQLLNTLSQDEIQRLLNLTKFNFSREMDEYGVPSNIIHLILTHITTHNDNITCFLNRKILFRVYLNISTDELITLNGK